VTVEFAERLHRIDRTRLVSLVRDVVGNEAAEVVDWTTHPVKGGATQETGRTYGLYRLKGTARIQDQLVPWTLI
jgi:hypothetical protein